MMKQIGRKAALLFLLCFLHSKAWAVTPATITLQSLAEQSWKTWQNIVQPKIRKPCPKIQVELKYPNEMHGLAGRTQGEIIQISKILSEQDQQSVFKHELAHNFLIQHFSSPKYKSIFFQELMSLSLSHDDFRILRDLKTFNLVTAAENYLATHYLQPKGGQRKFQEAIARLLSVAGAKENVLKKMAVLSADDAQDPDYALFNALTGHNIQLQRGPVHFLVKDVLTNEILYSEGNPDQKVDIGSILKPALFAVYPELMKKMVSRGTPEWACPHFSPSLAGRTWDWQLALIRSCNGFFLDQEKSVKDWSLMQSFVSPFVDKGQWRGIHSMATAIGLVPSMKMSLKQASDFYAWFAQEKPDFIFPLTQTVQAGTLAQQKESKWFSENYFALKSGSVRGFDSVPQQGWIIGIKKDSFGYNRFVVAIQASGYSGADLLPILYTKLKAKNMFFEAKAKVQVLGLMDERQIQFKCGENDKFYADGEILNQPMTPDHIRSASWFKCLNGPVLVDVPQNNGTLVTKKYWGRFQYTGREPIRINRTATLKEQRARSGSPFVFETSERSYVSRVLASEHAKGRIEVLKALAVVVRQNLHSHRHDDRPICDTTHCQLFNFANWASEKQLRHYTDAYDQIAFEPVIENDFMEFATGGTETWTAERSTSAVASLMSGLKIPFVTGAKWTEQKKSISCEKIRGGLKLPSCPEQIIQAKGKIKFVGRGEGHGLGLDLMKAEVLAAQGMKYGEILKHFYR